MKYTEKTKEGRLFNKMTADGTKIIDAMIAMNHLELKNKVLSELQLISDMAIQDVKNNNKNLDIDDFLSDHKLNERYDWVAVPISNNKKLAEKKDELISFVYPSNWRHTEDDNLISIDTFAGFFKIPINSTNQIHYAIKNGWGNGKSKPTTISKRILDFNGIELQKKIMIYRNAYLYGSCSYEESTSSYFGYKRTAKMSREEVVTKYKNSKPGDLIRSCWKFITNPETLEGVHTPWVDPQVTFTPWREVKYISDIPKYYRDKLQKVA